MTRAARWWPVHSLLAACPPGAVVVGVCWGVQQLAALPSEQASRAWLIAGLGLLALGIALGSGLGRWRLRAAARPVSAILVLVGLAFATGGWALLRAHAGLASRLPPALEGMELVVRGTVLDMPVPSAQGWRTRLRIEAIESPAGLSAGPITARVSWPSPEAGRPGAEPVAGRDAPFVAGEHWRLALRLRRPLALRNPGQFDAELRALEEGIDALGTVRVGPRAAVRPQRLAGMSFALPVLVERARTALRDAIERALADQATPVRGVVVALVVGDQSAIPADHWERFNRTGVGHLMSISGLHITMLAGLGIWSVRRLWRSGLRLPGRGGPAPPAAWLAEPHAAWVGAVVCAFAYSAIAGWGLPAQRTCWMLAVAGFALLAGRARGAREVLCTAAAVVCLLDPWAPMAAGFWLSFAAVAAIIWHGSRMRLGQAGADPAMASPRGSPRRPWRPRAIARVRAVLGEAWRSQVAATLALLPLGTLFFASVSLVGPLANAFSIPLVSGLITPLALAGGGLALLPGPLGDWVLQLTAWLTEALLAALAVCDGWRWASLVIPEPEPLALLLAVLACALLLAPWPIPGRVWAAGGLLPLLFTPARAPPPGELWLTAFDVGQGMAVLVETSAGRLLYDAGPAWSGDSDAGSRVLGPSLRARGIHRLETMVISHRDTDHAGGALSLLRQLAVDQVASSLPDDHPVVRSAARHRRCRRGDAWQWGDTRFEWLHPADDDPPLARRAGANPLSCVLRVQSPAGSVLLPGDIEAAQEAGLLDRLDATALRADLLVAPHHGSRTSSTAGFLKAVAPRWAIFQVGYRNRFGHPAPAVLQRYREQGIGVLRTDRDGAISIRLRAGAEPRIALSRREPPRYWRMSVPEAADAEAP
ncbi:MAG: DNA internalization-related competence protein ComEC/Rec2 [Betaproteobacteria bacterium]|nr:DNA internalization-related competence protein ComEC/Rec2 [Betaproteobacteria bacterium]